MKIAEVGIVTRVRGNLVDVQIENSPLLTNVPVLNNRNVSTGKMVLLVFIGGDLNNGIIIGEVS